MKTGYGTHSVCIVKTSSCSLGGMVVNVLCGKFWTVFIIVFLFVCFRSFYHEDIASLALISLLAGSNDFSLVLLKMLK